MSSIASIPVRELRGVGPKLAARLAEYGVHQVEDLLFHLPLRYQDRTRVTPIAAAREGADVVIEGEVRAADIVFGKRRSLVARIQDGSGTLTLRFFHFSAAQKNGLATGTRLRCFGQMLSHHQPNAAHTASDEVDTALLNARIVEITFRLRCSGKLLLPATAVSVSK